MSRTPERNSRAGYPSLMMLHKLPRTKTSPLLLAALLCLITTKTLAFDVWTISEPSRKMSSEATPGQWRMLAFWALDCVLCEQQKPRLSQFNQRYDQLSVLGIAIDGRQHLAAIKKRLQDKPVSFPNAVVDYPTFAAQFHAQFGQKFLVTPTYLLYSPTGDDMTIHTGTLDFTRLASIIKTPVTRSPDASQLR